MSTHTPLRRELEVIEYKAAQAGFRLEYQADIALHADTILTITPRWRRRG
jgi:hypothetical protein